MNRVAIKFWAAFDRYNGGEVAGFTPDVAQKLIDQGLAVRWSQDDEDRASLTRAQAVVKSHDLDQREADLAGREAALAEREAKLAALAEGAPKKQGKADADPAAPAA